NMLNFTVDAGTNTRSNSGVGSFNLIDRASNSMQHQFNLQMRETAVLSGKLVHEVRMEFSDNHSTTNPLTTGRTISVLDAFTSGGGGTVSDTTNKSVLFGNTLIYNNKNLTVKAGTQGDYYRNKIYN